MRAKMEDGIKEAQLELLPTRYRRTAFAELRPILQDGLLRRAERP